jgi:hypothetical protein
MTDFKIKFITIADNDYNSINHDKLRIQSCLTQIDNKLSIVNITKINNPESVFEDTKFILNKLSLKYENEIQLLIRNFGETKYRYEKSIEKDQFFDNQTLSIIRKSFYKRQFNYFNLFILLILICFILYILYILYLINIENQ